MGLSDPAQVEQTLKFLRTRSNPFDQTVASPGTEDETLSRSVPDWFEQEIDWMTTIAEQYRESKTLPSQLFWIVGDPGVGKTHLMWEFQHQILPLEQAYSMPRLVFQTSGEILQRDPDEFLLSEIYNRLMHKECVHILKAIGVRLSAKYLADSIRAMPPHDHYSVAPKGWMESSTSRQERVRQFLDVCDAEKKLEPGAIKTAWTIGQIKMEPSDALARVDSHLKSLARGDANIYYRRLVGLIMQIEFEDNFHPFADYIENRAYLNEPGIVTQDETDKRRMLLDSLFQILKTLKIPVVFLLDQLESQIKKAADGKTEESARTLASGLATIVSARSDICFFLFTATEVFNQVVGGAQLYAQARLRQIWNVEGHPSFTELRLNLKKLDELFANRIVARRLRNHRPESCPLPDTFPFAQEDIVEMATKSLTMRDFLDRCCKRYDGIVFAPPVLPPSLKEIEEYLRARWNTLKNQLPTSFGGSPDSGWVTEVQKSIVVWLNQLIPVMKETNPVWNAAESITDPGLHAVFNTISILWMGTEKAHSLAFAWWAGIARAKFVDYENRVKLFSKPELKCRVLVLLRKNGESDVKSTELSAKAIATLRADGKRIAILNIEDETIKQLIAFQHWLKEVQVSPKITRGGAGAQGVLTSVIRSISSPILAWVEAAHSAIQTTIVDAVPTPGPAPKSKTGPVAATKLPKLKG